MLYKIKFGANVCESVKDVCECAIESDQTTNLYIVFLRSHIRSARFVSEQKKNHNGNEIKYRNEDL